MPTISVLTPVHRPLPEHITETARAVLDQTLPAEWSLEWIVQEDDDESRSLGLLPKHDAIRYECNGRHLGVAATRNVALSRASGSLVQVLDQDDVLLPGALATLLPHFDDPRVHWAVAQADDLHPDGRRTSWPPALPFGLLPPGVVNSQAIEHDGNWQIHCAGLMIRTAVLRALGGWVASYGDDDIVMFAGLSEVAYGYHERVVTWLYRQHPGQMSRTPEAQQRSVAGRQVALQRVMAARATELGVTQASIRPRTVPIAGQAEKDKPRSA